MTSGHDRWALRPLERASRFQDWIFDTVAPTGVGPGVEVGAGIGTFTRRLLLAGIAPLLAIEPDPACAAELERRYAGEDRIEIVRETVPDSPALARLAGRVAYILCQNVLEHVEDDLAAVEAMAAALAPEGELALLVPAHPALFGRLDRRFAHHRRYTATGVQRLVHDAGLELTSLRSFNLIGLPGWFLANHTPVLDLTDRSLRMFDALVPLWRPIERKVRPPMGLSLIARARKPR